MAAGTEDGPWLKDQATWVGRFGMYPPPLPERLGLVELTHEARNNAVRALRGEEPA